MSLSGLTKKHSIRRGRCCETSNVKYKKQTSFCIFAMIVMDPGAVPEPAEYSSPPSPGGSVIMGEEEVKEMVALTTLGAMYK